MNFELGYIGVGSASRDVWEKAAQVMALGISDESTDETLFLRMDNRHHRIAVHQSEVEGLQYTGWDAGSEAGLDHLLARLSRNGVTAEEASPELCAQRWVQRLYSFVDLNGQRMELFVSQQIRHDPLKTSAPMEGRFVTGDQGMGHVVYGTTDLKASRDFYIDAMGFRMTDSVRGFMKADFLRCNPRHHSIAFMEMPQPCFVHLMIQGEVLNDVGRAMDRAATLGMEIGATLGRHNNDGMVSFYIPTPSGFDLEYGWDAVRIDDEANWKTATYDTGSLWGHRWTKKW